MSKCYILGVDVGGTYIRLGAVDTNKQLFKEVKMETSIIGSENTPEKLVELIADYVSGFEDGTIKAVSVGFPSTINKERSEILSTPNICGFNNIKIREMLKLKIGLPVFIEKDACMLVYNDLYNYGNVPEGFTIGIYYGTGLGNIILFNGTPVVGKNGVAGELGHIPVIGNPGVCSCGLKGCLELVAAGKGLEVLANQNYPDIPFDKLFEQKGGDGVLDAFVQNMASAAAIEISILDPDLVVIGGGIVNMAGFPKEKLLGYIYDKTRKPEPADSLTTIFSHSNNIFGGVIGAAFYAEKMLNL